MEHELPVLNLVSVAFFCTHFEECHNITVTKFLIIIIPSTEQNYFTGYFPFVFLILYQRFQKKTQFYTVLTNFICSTNC